MNVCETVVKEAIRGQAHMTDAEKADLFKTQQEQNKAYADFEREVPKEEMDRIETNLSKEQDFERPGPHFE